MPLTCDNRLHSRSLPHLERAVNARIQTVSRAAWPAVRRGV